LLGTTAVIWAGTAGAQDVTAPAPTDRQTAPQAGDATPEGGQTGSQISAQQKAADELLGDIVVTATRQNETVNRVPIAITAVSQRTLDQQGVKSVQDIARIVPSLSFRRSNFDGSPQIALRGIISNVGASTTGVYLDDTPLQKRGVNGALTGNGTPVPLLFDLERVEVLRGPQGTLFGSGSEGGTLRFITPPPSLTTFSGYGRAEASITKDGSPGYEVGIAIGGPLIEDKLGFRASIFTKHIGGVLDHVSIYDGRTFAEDTDSGEQRAARLVMTWAPTEQLRVTPSVYYSYDRINDLNLSYENIPQFTTNGGTFTNRVRVGEPAGTPNSTGFNLDFPNTTIPGYTFGPYRLGNNKTPIGVYYDQNCGACTAYTPFGPSTITTAPTVVNGVTYPGRVLNIAGQQPGRNQVELARSTRVNRLYVPSLTLDHDFDSFSVKAISSFAADRTRGQNEGVFGIRNAVAPGGTATANTVGGAFVNAAGVSIPGGIVGVPTFPIGIPPLPTGGTGGNFIVIPGLPTQNTQIRYANKRDQFTQEVRFASDTGPDERFTWVAGAFYSKAKQRSRLSQPTSEAVTSYFLRGLDNSFTLNGFNMGPDIPQPVAFACDPTPTGVAPGATYNCVQTAPSTFTFNDVARQIQIIDETEIAAFGEANYLVTDKLKVTAGARYAYTKNKYRQELAGSLFGSPFAPVFVPRPPTAADPDGNPYPVNGDGQFYTVTTGQQVGKPFNPKLAVSYQADERNLFYLSAAKGYRAGGVNAPVNRINCAAQLAALNITDSPTEYGSDSVMSYEGGAKLRIAGVQLNSSIFYIDWKDPQLTVQLSCGNTYIANAGKAVSKGFDVQAQTRLFDALSLSGSLSYTDAQYTRNVTNTLSATPAPNSFITRKGDRLPVSKWQYAVSGQYDVPLSSSHNGYLRADYQYSGKYRRNLANSTAFDPLTSVAEATHNLNLRAGVNFGRWDLNAFVLNATNSTDRLNETHFSGNAQLTYILPRPRELGLQAAFRY
jgi:outer membrane receptor protein involved in Fe transport